MLRQRPQGDDLHPACQGILDSTVGQHIRRAGEEELARLRVAVDCLLDRQKKIGRALDLIDHCRFRKPGDEAGRVGQGGIACRLVVQADHSRGLLMGRNLGDQGALADLPRAHDEDHPGVRQRLDDQRPSGAFDEVIRHARNSRPGCADL